VRRALSCDFNVLAGPSTEPAVHSRLGLAGQGIRLARARGTVDHGMTVLFSRWRLGVWQSGKTIV